MFVTYYHYLVDSSTQRYTLKIFFNIFLFIWVAKVLKEEKQCVWRITKNIQKGLISPAINKFISENSFPKDYVKTSIIEAKQVIC